MTGTGIPSRSALHEELLLELEEELEELDDDELEDELDDDELEELLSLEAELCEAELCDWLDALLLEDELADAELSDALEADDSLPEPPDDEDSEPPLPDWLPPL